MATGGSTNAVLHFLAIAHAAEVDWSIDDFERIRRKVPVLCDLKPSGRYLAIDLHRAGGIPQVMKLLLDAGLLHGDCLTISGQTIAQTLADVPSAPRADQDVIRSVADPIYAAGHLAILRGNLAPEGSVAKITGLKNPSMKGPARVFDSEDAAMAAILADRIQAGDILVIRYEGPKGGPGMREMLAPTSAIVGKGLGESVGLITDGRQHRPRARGRHHHHRRPPAQAAPARRRSGTCPPPRRLEGPRAALHARRPCKVRLPRLERQPRRRDRRRHHLLGQGHAISPFSREREKGRG
jgi:dihydroxyacid dehydratase/phosphogluconate dehydratase